MPDWIEHKNDYTRADNEFNLIKELVNLQVSSEQQPSEQRLVCDTRHSVPPAPGGPPTVVTNCFAHPLTVWSPPLLLPPPPAKQQHLHGRIMALAAGQLQQQQLIMMQNQQLIMTPPPYALAAAAAAAASRQNAE